jgi:hypothetical protein
MVDEVKLAVVMARRRWGWSRTRLDHEGKDHEVDGGEVRCE